MNINDMENIINEVFDYCFKNENDKGEIVIIDSIFNMDPFYFTLERLKEKAALIEEAIAMLPSSKNLTFMDVLSTKEGETWAKDKNSADKLAAMALGLGIFVYDYALAQRAAKKRYFSTLISGNYPLYMRVK